MDDLFVSQDYKLVEDAWNEHGRRTYVHDEDATRTYISNLAKTLRSMGWQTDKNQLRAFRHSTTGYIIELEPGGSETSGHFLHYIKDQN